MLCELQTVFLSEPSKTFQPQSTTKFSAALLLREIFGFFRDNSMFVMRKFNLICIGVFTVGLDVLELADSVFSFLLFDRTSITCALRSGSTE